MHYDLRQSTCNPGKRNEISGRLGGFGKLEEGVKGKYVAVNKNW